MIAMENEKGRGQNELQEAISKRAEASPETTQEGKEKLIDFIIEQTILQAEMIDQGVNGIIFRLDIEVLDATVRAQFEEEGFELNNENAIKMLKVYKKGQGRAEFDMQQRAQEIIGDQAKNYAMIPKPNFYRDLELSDHAFEQMRDTYGLKEKRVEIIMMEFVPGKDLGTALVEKAKELRRADDQISAEGMRLDDALAHFQHAAMSDEFAEQLFAYLDSQNIRIDPTVAQRIKKTLDVLHKNGIAHRDAHERNIMISEGEGGLQDINNVWVIDFGNASEFSGVYEGNQRDIFAHPTDGIPYPFDGYILDKLARLSGPNETKQEQQEREEAERINQRSSRFRRSRTDLTKQREAWIERNNGNKIDAGSLVPKFYKHFLGSVDAVSRASRWDQFSDYLLVFIEDGLATSDEIIESLSIITLEDSTQPNVRKRINDIKAGLSYKQNTESQDDETR
jgi:serine/threonine protein kinase